MSDKFGSISHEAERVGELQKRMANSNSMLQQYSSLHDMMLDLTSKSSLGNVDITIEISAAGYGRRTIEIKTDNMKSRTLELYGDIVKISMQAAHEQIIKIAKEISGAKTEEKDHHTPDE